MNIQCTQNLLDKLKMTAAAPSDAQPFFDWHARMLVIDRHNTVLLTHDLSRLSLILCGMKAANFKKIVGYFQQALTEWLLAEDIDQTTIDRYFQMAGEIRFAKTSNRSISAQMTQIGLEIPFFYEDFEQEQIVQTDFNLSFSSHFQKIGKHYHYPRDIFLTAMKQFMLDGQTAFTTEELTENKSIRQKAFVLTVQLPCGDRPVWRKLVVPAKCTFEELHRTLQISFNWQDEHLHEFQVMDDKGHVVAQSKSNDPFDPDWPVERDIDFFSEKKRISAYLPQYRSLRYLYDFGDDWLHMIDLEETLNSYEGKFTICLDGEGTAPPEDVGGEDGYRMFLNIVENDADTKEKQTLLEWADEQNWKPFDRQKINERLRWLFL